MKTVDYLLEALKHHGGRADGFLTDQPVGIELPDDAIVQMRYDSQLMKWIFSRPSQIRYPTSRQLIRQYRKSIRKD
jgi:hypothetical protein